MADEDGRIIELTSGDLSLLNALARHSFEALSRERLRRRFTVAITRRSATAL
jgi:DNA-binding response OmpR family regulator